MNNVDKLIYESNLSTKIWRGFRDGISWGNAIGVGAAASAIGMSAPLTIGLILVVGIGGVLGLELVGKAAKYLINLLADKKNPELDAVFKRLSKDPEIANIVKNPSKEKLAKLKDKLSEEDLKVILDSFK